METTTVNYTNKIKSIGRFFSQTDKGAYTFAVANDELLQQNINQNLLQLAANKNNKLAVVNFKKLASTDIAPIAALRQYIKEQANLDGLIITNLYGLWLSKQFPDLLTQLNFVREEILKLNVPILFWVNDELTSLLSRHAKDLYAQRHNFNLYFTETANRTNELHADQYIAIERSKAVPNKQQHESRLKLLFKQLEKAEAGGEDKTDIANDIVIEILEVYTKLPQMSPAFLRLFEEYEIYFNKYKARTNFTIAYGLQEANNLDKAKNYYKRALKKCRRLVKVNSETYLPNLAMTLNNIGEIQRKNNEIKSAETSFLEALGIRKKLAKVNPQAYLPEVAMTLNSLGALYIVKNEFDEAEKFHSEALNIYRKFVEFSTKNYSPIIASLLNNLGTIYFKKNKFEKAERAYLEALGIRRNLAKANRQKYSTDIASSLNNLGTLYFEKREFHKAEKSFLEALALRRKLAEVNSQSYLPFVAGSLNNLGSLQNNKNEFEKAEKSYLEALEIRQQLVKSNPSAFEIDLAQTHINLSQFFRYDKPKPSQSLQHAKAAAALYTKYAATVPHAKEWLQVAEAEIKHWEEQHKN